MSSIHKNLRRLGVAAIAFVIGVGAVAVSAQDSDKQKSKDKMKVAKSFCSNDYWSNGDRQSARELREVTIPATSNITVDGRQNGGISIKGEDRNDVLVRACIQTWADSEEAAKAKLAGIKINTSGTIQGDGDDDNKWSVSFELRVPRSTNVNLTARNGGISIYGIDGNAEFETQNGGVSLGDVAGNFKGRTINGGVHVKLVGGSWKGSGLDVTTTNGGVNISMPENYAARIVTGTVNGGYSTDIPALEVTREDKGGDSWNRHRPTKISMDINGGGAPVRVVTTNGGVRISNSANKE